ncbi:anti-dorsalizing morphogenic protein isoform X2 [Stegostoma tigrinum]|uniref:anti-dorsalizing morphogenic protein isoform X2 n=1 Tax=Stegostoma tigrinum TaxID=3053191 RepID=UPI00202B5419|nr:anti-dorsalizing morphogenic protein isoform X2 [Stegostoma tigrinum]
MCSRLGASLLLLLIFLRPNCAASLPGHNQQVRSQALKRLLEVFGMVDAPQSPHRVRQPPQYMLDLYNAVADVDGVTKQPDLLVGNTVRSFLDRSRSQQLQFFFNLSSVAKSETILSAELHLFKLRGRLFRDTLHHRQHFCQVYTWTHDKKSNKGLMVIVQTLAGQQTNNHFVRFATARDHHSSKQPMLVLFTDEERRGITTSSSLKDMGTENPFISHRILQNKASQNRNTRSLHFQGCQRHHLYVDFEEIGWSGWIISPRGYNAYHCKGACVFPLGKNMRPTNHATVQSIINALKLANDVASPCCIPDKLFSINLLYFDDDENVVLKQYDDMVAGSCGCH